jgi:isoleucyl-tRNA synthetase
MVISRKGTGYPDPDLGLRPVRTYGSSAPSATGRGKGTPVPDRTARTWTKDRPCSCGGTMKRSRTSSMSGFDSRCIMGYLGYPAKRRHSTGIWPADFITEMQDQTRAGFFPSRASTIAFGRAPYRSV